MNVGPLIAWSAGAAAVTILVGLVVVLVAGWWRNR